MTYKCLEIKKQLAIKAILKEFRCELYNKNLSFSYLNDLSYKYANKAKVIAILDKNREHLGFVAMYCNDSVNKVAFISMIVVKNRYQHRGIGQKLLEIAVNIVRKNGMKCVRLCVDKENIQAQKFYIAQKFSIIEENDKYWVMNKNIL